MFALRFFISGLLIYLAFSGGNTHKAKVSRQVSHSVSDRFVRLQSSVADVG